MVALLAVGDHAIRHPQRQAGSPQRIRAISHCSGLAIPRQGPTPVAERVVLTIFEPRGLGLGIFT